MLVTPSALLYVTGGLAVAGINTDGVLSGVTAASLPTSVAWNNDATKWGWVVGAGVEARLGGNWTGKLEGLSTWTTAPSRAALFSLPVTSSIPLRFDYSSKVTDVVLRGRRELPLRRPGGREVLISAKLLPTIKRPGIVRGFFVGDCSATRRFLQA